MVDVISVRALAGLALLVPLQLWAQSAERPQLRPGDRWQFVEYQTVPSRVPNREWVITGVSATGFEGKENGEPLLLDAELNTLESPRARYSALRSLRFPMSVGAEWRYDSDWLFKATGSSGTSTARVQVLAYEPVVVPAGTFDAYRLVSRTQVRGKSPKGSLIDAEIVSTYWYSPAARTVVRSVTHNPYVGTSTVELVTYGPWKQ
jgi:hypothetical protein